MMVFIRLIIRDLSRALASGGMAMPIVFFLLVATLYPFAVGPDAQLLARSGGGMLWVAALLAALLPADRLIAPDADSGVLDQLAVRGISDEIVVTAKMVAHWIGFALPLMLAAIPASALLNLDSTLLSKLEIGLLLGPGGAGRSRRKPDRRFEGNVGAHGPPHAPSRHSNLDLRCRKPRRHRQWRVEIASRRVVASCCPHTLCRRCRHPRRSGVISR
jgi:hypothetical protein